MRPQSLSAAACAATLLAPLQSWAADGTDDRGERPVASPMKREYEPRWGYWGSVGTSICWSEQCDASDSALVWGPELQGGMILRLPSKTAATAWFDFGFRTRLDQVVGDDANARDSRWYERPSAGALTGFAIDWISLRTWSAAWRLGVALEARNLPEHGRSLDSGPGNYNAVLSSEFGLDLRFGAYSPWLVRPQYRYGRLRMADADSVVQEWALVIGKTWEGFDSARVCSFGDLLSSCPKIWDDRPTEKCKGDMNTPVEDSPSVVVRSKDPKKDSDRWDSPMQKTWARVGAGLSFSGNAYSGVGVMVEGGRLARPDTGLNVTLARAYAFGGFGAEHSDGGVGAGILGVGWRTSSKYVDLGATAYPISIGWETPSDSDQADRRNRRFSFVPVAPYVALNDPPLLAKQWFLTGNLPLMWFDGGRIWRGRYPFFVVLGAAL